MSFLTLPGLRFNEHMEDADGPLVFQLACKLGLEGIVSQRAMKREAEEDWGR